jgi:hypothetical protein
MEARLIEILRAANKALHDDKLTHDELIAMLQTLNKQLERIAY